MAKKKVKKTLFAQAVIKKHKKSSVLPDFGQGPGVLITQEIEFTDDIGRGFDSPLFKLSLMEYEDALLREAVEIKWSEKDPNGSTKGHNRIAVANRCQPGARCVRCKS